MYLHLVMPLDYLTILLLGKLDSSAMVELSSCQKQNPVQAHHNFLL